MMRITFAWRPQATPSATATATNIPASTSTRVRRREPPRRRADRTSKEATAVRALRATSPKTRGLSTEEGEDNERERRWCLMNVSEHLWG